MISVVTVSDLTRPTITGQSEGVFKCAQVEHEKKYPYAEKMGLRPREGRFFANYPLTRGYIVNPDDKLTTKVSKWFLGFFSVLSLGSLPAILLMNDLLILKMRKESLALPPIDERSLFRRELIYSQICTVIDFFWRGYRENVIISLFEKGKLKSLEEIHTFLIGEVIEMHVKKGLSKEQIVRALNLPFTRQKHPMSYFFDLEEIISKYESGMNNQMIFGDLAKQFESAKGELKLRMSLCVKEGDFKVLGMERESTTDFDANFLAILKKIENFTLQQSQ